MSNEKRPVNDVTEDGRKIVYPIWRDDLAEATIMPHAVKPCDNCGFPRDEKHDQELCYKTLCARADTNNLRKTGESREEFERDRLGSGNAIHLEDGGAMGSHTLIVAVGVPAHSEIVGKHIHLFAKPENYTLATNKGEDCICGGFASGGKSRTMIANCPCCDGIQYLVEDLCDCDDSSYIKVKVVLPPNSATRFRRIECVEPIS